MGNVFHREHLKKQTTLQLSEFMVFLVVFSHLVLLSSQLCLADPPQIQDIVVETGQADQKETRSAKDALLLWCQMKTAGSVRGRACPLVSHSWTQKKKTRKQSRKHHSSCADARNILLNKNIWHCLVNMYIF